MAKKLLLHVLNVSFASPGIKFFLGRTLGIFCILWGPFIIIQLCTLSYLTIIPRSEGERIGAH